MPLYWAYPERFIGLWTAPTAITAPIYHPFLTSATAGTAYWYVEQTTSSWATTSQTHQTASALEYYPHVLARAYFPMSPAVIMDRDERERIEALREQEAYRRAVAEHDEQETARLARVIAERATETARRQVAETERAHLAAMQRAERNTARERAKELLLGHLTVEQRESFVRNGWFVVEGGRTKTRYRIRAVESMVANIDVLDHDRVTHRLCGHVPRELVPLGDQLLAQKMMLEFAENDFLRIANRHGP